MQDYKFPPLKEARQKLDSRPTLCVVSFRHHYTTNTICVWVEVGCEMVLAPTIHIIGEGDSLEMETNLTSTWNTNDNLISLNTFS